MKLVVGLGNPGEKYNNTRHNLGFWFLDKLVKEKGLSWEDNKKFKAMVARDGDLVYLKPLTFMNLSGQAVSAFLRYYKLIPSKFSKFLTPFNKGGRGILDLSESLTVIHDDLDIKLGEYKVSVDSRSGGNKGVASIIQHLKTKNFKRIRIGIKSEAQGQIPTEKFVLGRLTDSEYSQVESLYERLKNEIF